MKRHTKVAPIPGSRILEWRHIHTTWISLSMLLSCRDHKHWWWVLVIKFFLDFKRDRRAICDRHIFKTVIRHWIYFRQVWTPILCPYWISAFIQWIFYFRPLYVIFSGISRTFPKIYPLFIPFDRLIASSDMKKNAILRANQYKDVWIHKLIILFSGTDNLGIKSIQFFSTMYALDFDGF